MTIPLLSVHTAVPLAGDGFRASAGAPDPALAASARASAPSSPSASGSLEDAVETLGRSRSELSFHIDRDADRVVVTVTDRATGEVLLQLPSEEALRIARRLAGRDPALIAATA